MVYRTFPKTRKEYEELRDLTKRTGAEFIGGNKRVHVSTAKGTDLTLEITDKLLQSVCSAECNKPGMASYIPAGQLALGVVPGTANGTIVVDSSIHPIKRILKDTITFKVKDGNFCSIEGGEEAAEFQRIVNACPYAGKTNIAEFGIGCNPITEIIGNSFGDECYYGGAHIGFGSNMAFGGDIFTDNWHCDGVFVDASIEVDGKQICKDGQFLL